MKVRKLVHIARRGPSGNHFPLLLVLAFLLCFSVSTAEAQGTHPGRGAISAQDLAKLVAPAASGSDAADQVCARFATGSATTAPPELESQNGVLEVSFKFLTTTDSQGLVRYCFVTDTGLESSGQATLTTPINGATGSNDLTAFYQGDATYMESVSAAIPITISNFAMSSPGVTAPLGSAAIAPVTINVATNYTSLINLTCTMPSSLIQSACFIDPNSITGTGQVSLRVNTTPPHPMSSMRTGGPGWLAAGGGVSLAGVFLLALPRRKWRGKAMFVLSLMAIIFTVIGCGGTTKTDPGTPKGTYTVVVRATAGSGSSQSQATVNVPVTIQ